MEEACLLNIVPADNMHTTESVAAASPSSHRTPRRHIIPKIITVSPEDIDNVSYNVASYLFDDATWQRELQTGVIVSSCRTMSLPEQYNYELSCSY